MLILKNICYRDLFSNVSFTISGKTSIIGKNGAGKSTLLKIIMDEIHDYGGELSKKGLNIAYFPQQNRTFKTIADVFGFEKEIIALESLNKEYDYEILEGHWSLDEEINKRLDFFNLKFPLRQPFDNLSGGEQVKIILSSLITEKTNFLILDEPTNNLDREGKETLYNYLKNFNGGVLLVSHDRNFLNLMTNTIELRQNKCFIYGGNYEFYRKEREIEKNNWEQIHNDNLKKLAKQEKQAIANKNLIQQKIKQGNRDLEKKKFSKKAFGLIVSQAEASEGKMLKQAHRKETQIEANIKEIKEKIEIKQKIYFENEAKKNTQ
jgi:ATPase subunit of ABC transporter with duplicated ATPase domains